MHKYSQERSREVGSGVHTWRVTTAVRVFTLAIAAGQSLSTGVLNESAALLFALILVGVVAVVLEAGLLGRRSPWIPVVEGAIVATLLTTSLPAESLLIYLAVPPVVAGIRHGWVSTTNTALSAFAGVVASSMGYRELGLETERLSASFPWLAVGLGAGLLAAWQSRSVRRLEAIQAPYATAHRLLTQLHTLTHQGPVGLDSPAVAGDLASAIAGRTNASGAVVMLRSPTGVLEPYTRIGDDGGLVEVAALADANRRAVVDGCHAALLLRVQDDVFGVLALGSEQGWLQQDMRQLQRWLDERALRLKTALLFDDVRQMATSEERSRLAREIHDGVAQEMVALGYLVDEVEEHCEESPGIEAAARLRAEISRILSELRLSIYDLRHESADRGISSALSSYVREVNAGSDLRVHLTLDDQDCLLSRRTELEVMRIAKEAIGNACKHARAINLWVTWQVNDETIWLVIEDDGIGSAAPKEHHYGMHTMRERAQKIGAELTVAERRDGGTVVSLCSTLRPHPEGVLRHEHSSPAGR